MHDSHSKAACSSRKGFLILTPHKYRLGLRVDNDIEAVLRTIIDDDVQVERVGDASSGSLHYVDAWQREAFRLEPTLRLHLCRRTGRLRTLRQEDALPLPCG